MKQILVVEDSKFMCIAIERVLTKAGYKVSSTSDGEGALRMAREQCFDLILLDMLLPKLGGPQVLQSLKCDAATKQVPVIVLSSLPQANEEKLRAEGAAAYLEKSSLQLESNSDCFLKLVAKTLEKFARATSA